MRLIPPPLLEMLCPERFGGVPERFGEVPAQAFELLMSLGIDNPLKVAAAASRFQRQACVKRDVWGRQVGPLTGAYSFHYSVISLSHFPQVKRGLLFGVTADSFAKAILKVSAHLEHKPWRTFTYSSRFDNQHDTASRTRHQADEVVRSYKVLLATATNCEREGCPCGGGWATRTLNGRVEGHRKVAESWRTCGVIGPIHVSIMDQLVESARAALEEESCG